MRNLSTKEENLIDDLWTAVEQWDDCDGMVEGNENKCNECPFQIVHYDPRYGNEYHQCLKTFIEQVHEEVCT
jgi:hypothetical protein